MNYHERIILSEPRAREILRESGGKEILALSTALIEDGNHAGDISKALAMYVLRDHFCEEYSDFSKEGLAVDLASIVAIAFDEMLQATSFLVAVWTLLFYERVGCRDYRVSQGIGQRFLATELRGLTTDDIRLPYPVIHIDMPDLGFTYASRKPGMFNTICGVFVKDIVDRSERFLQFALVSLDDDRDYRIMSLSLPMDGGLQMSELQEVISWRLERDMNLHNRPKESIDVSVKFFDDTWPRLWPWILNVIFYVTHSDSELRVEDANKRLAALRKKAAKAQGKRKKKLEEQIAGERSHNVIVVGATVSVDDDLPKTASEVESALRVRSLVAGHWQRYAVGPGRVDRSWRFREPFWRGTGPEVPAVHEVR